MGPRGTSPPSKEVVLRSLGDDELVGLNRDGLAAPAELDEGRDEIQLLTPTRDLRVTLAPSILTKPRARHAGRCVRVIDSGKVR